MIYQLIKSISIIFICLSGTVYSFDYDPNDFAVAVVDYQKGSGDMGGFDNPATSLGRPTLMTKGDGFFLPPTLELPVVPVYPPRQVEELVRIGQGGSITLKFSHPVRNDTNNPYGIDFIVFGNAMQAIGANESWLNDNPEETTVRGLVFAEPGIVSVSQDGLHWYTFDPNTGPYADDFAPAAAFQWDRQNNQWTHQLDPTRPVDPGLSAADFEGKTVADMIDAYQGAAGGTGFDLEDVSLDWILYVRISDNPSSAATTEIDDFADVRCCGDYKHPFPAGDLDQDCRVGMNDLTIVLSNWLPPDPGNNNPEIGLNSNTKYPLGDADHDGTVNLNDIALLAENWLSCTWNCF